jgi:hypothetical protein
MDRRRVRTHLTEYKTSSGARRRIRLYECWCNLQGRLRGGKTSSNPVSWEGKGCEFLDWSHFRSWALKSGYRRGVELDRIDSGGPYGPHNCQWLEKVPHARKTRAGHKARCKCATCGYRRPVRMQAVAESGEYIPF